MYQLPSSLGWGSRGCVAGMRELGVGTRWARMGGTVAFSGRKKAEPSKHCGAVRMAECHNEKGHDPRSRGSTSIPFSFLLFPSDFSGVFRNDIFTCSLSEASLLISGFAGGGGGGQRPVYLPIVVLHWFLSYSFIAFCGKQKWTASFVYSSTNNCCGATSESSTFLGGVTGPVSRPTKKHERAPIRAKKSGNTRASQKPVEILFVGQREHES